MTSGTGIHYKSVADAFTQIVAKDGVRSLFKGAGANIVRGVASAGVLSLYDKFQEMFFGKVYSGGPSLESIYPACVTNPGAPSRGMAYRLWLISTTTDGMSALSCKSKRQGIRYGGSLLLYGLGIILTDNELKVDVELLPEVEGGPGKTRSGNSSAVSLADGSQIHKGGRTTW